MRPKYVHSNGSPRGGYTCDLWLRDPYLLGAVFFSSPNGWLCLWSEVSLLWWQPAMTEVTECTRKAAIHSYCFPSSFCFSSSPFSSFSFSSLLHQPVCNFATPAPLRTLRNMNSCKVVALLQLTMQEQELTKFLQFQQVSLGNNSARGNGRKFYTHTIRRRHKKAARTHAVKFIFFKPARLRLD